MNVPIFVLMGLFHLNRVTRTTAAHHRGLLKCVCRARTSILGNLLPRRDQHGRDQGFLAASVFRQECGSPGNLLCRVLHVDRNPFTMVLLQRRARHLLSSPGLPHPTCCTLVPPPSLGLQAARPLATTPLEQQSCLQRAAVCPTSKKRTASALLASQGEMQMHRKSLPVHSGTH